MKEHLLLNNRYEKNISTKKGKEKGGTWLSRSNGDQVGARRPREATGGGKKEVVCVNPFVMYKRLRKAEEIQKVFLKGKSFCFQDLCVRTAPNAQKESRFAFLCGKKSFPLAVSRNLLRRRMRESVRKRVKDIIPGTDIVCMFRGTKERSFREVEENMRLLLERANLLKKNNG